MILVVCNIKGGVGKSCIAQNLAVYLQTLQNSDVLLVDADPQKTTTDWVQERKSNTDLPSILSVQLTGNIRDELISLEGSNKNIIVDCGGHDSEIMRSALSVASLVLIPFRPKRRDLKKLPEMSEIINLVLALNPDSVIRSVITQAPHLQSQVKRILEAKDACKSFEMNPLNSILCNRNIYDDSDEEGFSVIEQSVDVKGKKEFIDMAEELFKEV